jgi:hypothetical protein
VGEEYIHIKQCNAIYIYTVTPHKDRVERELYINNIIIKGWYRPVLPYIGVRSGESPDPHTPDFASHPYFIYDLGRFTFTFTDFLP